ncbi:ESX secretion-associated protein EspG [Tsukamurella pseudospumae]|uniref:ESX secretion-associated protein EspG n=1 Tax=Tsukamurella pseudospumae TaxID=239498 RepID=UPI0018D39DC6|nr:ESX secretion-associated protein EspG [Tsukamurella pseudospumae]
MTVDELLLLMRLSDVTELGPVVLAVHPNVYRPDDQRTVDLAVLPGLLAAGLVGEDGGVDPFVRRWLHALQAPDAGIDLRVFEGDSVLRGAVVRCGEQVVVAFRYDDEVTIQGFMADRDAFDTTVVEPLWRVLGAAEPADIESITLGAAELAGIVATFDPSVEDRRAEREFRGRLREFDVPESTLDVLVEASRYSGRRAELIYQRVSESGVRVRADWALGVMDTTAGRVLSVTARGAHGEQDVTISPGTRKRFAAGLVELVERGGARGWLDPTD